MTDYPAFVAQRFTKRHTGPEGLLHAAVGIVGELIELAQADDRANLIEELGDVEFYVEAARQLLPPPGGREDPLPLSADSAIKTMIDCAGMIQDYAKKWWVYGKEPVFADVADLVEHLAGLLAGYYDLIGTTRAEVIEANMVKLRKRYPDGYTDALAIARLDKE